MKPGCPETNPNNFRPSAVKTPCYCRKCAREMMRRNLKTEKGHSTQLYIHMRTPKGKRLSRSEPTEYTLKEFRHWLFRQKNWDNLYKNWVASGYKKNLSPSIDRIDPRGTYVFSNMRLCTFGENKKKQFHDVIAFPMKNNTSGKTGVSWHKNNKKWGAGIGYKGKWHHLEESRTLEGAIKIREQAERDIEDPESDLYKRLNQL